MNKLARDLVKALRNIDRQKTEAYDTPATVTRIENGTAWVHIPGGIDETPVKLTVNAKTGDTVQLRVANGTAWITGNATAPPTDDESAIYAQNIAKRAAKSANRANTAAEEAGKIAKEANEIASANNQHFYYDQNGAHVEYNQEDSAGYNSLWNANGMLFRKGPNYLVSISQTAVAFYDGDANTASNIVASFGKNGINIGGAFIVDSNGNASFAGSIDASSGTIGGWNINATSLYRTNENWGNANGLYFGSSGLSIKDKFKVNSSGVLTATEANIIGTITGSSGEFTTGFDVNVPLVTNGYKLRINTGHETSQSLSYARLGIEKNGVFHSGVYASLTETALVGGSGVGAGINSEAGAFVYGAQQVNIFTGQGKSIYLEANSGHIYLNGFELLKTVPANAVFTDTVVPGYTAAANSDIADKNVASGTDMVNLGSFSLPAGHWIVYVVVRFASNTSGRRAVNISESSGGSAIDIAASDIVAPASGGATFLRIIHFLHPTSTTRYYVNCYQNSGSSLSVTTRYGAWKICN